MPCTLADEPLQPYPRLQEGVDRALGTLVGASAVDRAAEVKRADRFIARLAFGAVANEQVDELFANRALGFRIGYDLGQKRPDRAGLILLVPAQKLKQEIDPPHIRLGRIARRQFELAMQRLVKASLA